MTGKSSKIPNLPQLKNYQILERVGAGGMATVYKAIQKSLQRVVAIKELKDPIEEEENDTTVKRFKREAMAASSLSHENIISVHDFFLHKQRLYLVMEYVGGVDLSTILSHCKKLPIEIAAMITLQVVRALEYAHAMGLVHRDIKPGNIMVSSSGEVKLMDFGVVQIAGHDALTLPGTFVGTPRHMSPEQVLGNPIDFRSDLFSVGIILYEMVTGKKLFDAPDHRLVFFQITKGRIHPAERIRPGLPPNLAGVIRRCLKRDPKRRFKSTQQLRRTLEDFLGDQRLLTMRERVAAFFKAQEILPSLGEDISSTVGASIRKYRVGDAMMKWLVPGERHGLWASMMAATVLAIGFSLAVWWQNPKIHFLPNDPENQSGVKVIVHPWGHVFVDGNLRETTPFEQPIVLHPGGHRLQVRHPNYESRSVEIEVDRGETKTVVVNLEVEKKMTSKRK